MKKYIFYYLVLGLISLISCSKNSINRSDHVLTLNLEGKKYEKLWLRTEYYTLKTPYSDGKIPVTLALEIEGTSNDGYNWSFIVPDSIYKKSIKDFIIKSQPFDFELRKEELMLFSLENKDESLGSIEFDQNQITINAKYKKTVINDQYKNNEDIAYILTDTFVLAPTFVYDIFSIKYITKDTNIEIFLNFSDFAKLPYENYDEEFQKRIAYVQKYPNSKLLFNHFLEATGYKDKEDMKLIFNNFSDSLKNSKEGKQIMEYLIEIIAPIALDTTRLINTKTKQSELIVENPSKYTLVIFSASWCGPCHKQIPLLKEIYKDLGKKLNIVYISIDHKNDIDSWNKLMNKENIPWRSLFADEKYKGLKEKYSIKGIPFSILIYPHGEEEEIDVRLKNDRDKLYNLINNNK